MATTTGYIDYTEQGSAPTTPSTGHWRVFTKSDGLYVVDDAGSVTGPFISSAGSGAVATDTIWDAAGDLVVGTGANTGAKLTVGSAGALLEVVSGTPAWRGHVGASYSTNAGTSIATGTGLVIVDFEDSVYDPQSAVTVGASWHYTAPYDGYYRVAAMVLFAANTGWANAERGLLQVFKNTSAYRTIDRKDNYNSGGSNLNMLLTGSTMVQLAAGDTVDIRVSQNSGGSIALNGAADSNWVDITRVR